MKNGCCGKLFTSCSSIVVASCSSFSCSGFCYPGGDAVSATVVPVVVLFIIVDLWIRIAALLHSADLVYVQCIMKNK